MIELRTERLDVGPFRDEDARFVLEVHQHPGIAEFVSSAVLTDLDGARARIAEFRARDEHPVHGVPCVRLHDGTPVALVMLKPIPASDGVDLDDVEIGWRAHPAHEGRGYVAEAARAVLEHAWDHGLGRVVAVTDPRNAPSQRVCRRIGMAERGLTRDYYDQELTHFVVENPRGGPADPERVSG